MVKLSIPFKPNDYETASSERSHNESLADLSSILASQGGLIVKGNPTLDGQIHRVPVFSHPRSDAGWYVGHATGTGLLYCSFGDWHQPGTLFWSSRSEAQWTEIDRAAVQHAQEAARAAKQRDQEEAARQAEDLIARLSEARPDHPYLIAKGIKPNGALQDGERLVIPMADAEGDITSYQSIGPGGDKLYLKNGRKAGSYFWIGDEPKGRLIIAEGFATAASIHEATGEQVYVAFDTSGLKPAAEVLRALYPTTPIVFAADNDQWTKEPVANPGITFAQRAAAAIGNATVIWPEFDADDATRPTDFNDLATRGGDVRKHFRACHDVKPLIAAQPFIWRDPALIPKRQWLYGHHLIRKFLSATIAPGGVGKSALVITDALAMASGQKLLHNKVYAPARVWVWNLEDPAEELERRVVATAQFHNIGPANVLDRLLLNSGRDTPCVVATQTRNGAMIAMPVVDAIISEIKRHSIDVLIIDPFISSHELDENKNVEIDRVVKRAWGHVAEETGCAIDLVHHARKMGGEEVTAESARGASALVSAARDTRVLNVMTPEEAERAAIKTHRSYFRTMSDKMNLAPPADKSDWHKIVSVKLANEDNIGVVTPWDWPNPFKELSQHDVDRVLAAIAAGKYNATPQAKDWVGYVIAKELGISSQERASRERINTMLRKWAENGLIVVFEDRDEKSRKMASYVRVNFDA